MALCRHSCHNGSAAPSSALCIAAQEGNETSLRVLIANSGGSGESGADGENGKRLESSDEGSENGGGCGETTNNDQVNMRDPVTNYTPLHHAVIGGHLSCVELLLSQPGIDVNAAHFATAVTPLYLAMSSKEKDMQIVEALLSSSAENQLSTRAPFAQACESGSREMVNSLFHQHKDYLLCGNKWYTSPPRLSVPHMSAIRGENLPVLDLLFHIDDTFRLKVSPDDQYWLVRAALGANNLAVFSAAFARFRRNMTSTGRVFGERLLAKAMDRIALLRRLLAHGCKPYHVERRRGRSLKQVDGAFFAGVFSNDGRFHRAAFQLIVQHVPRNLIETHDAGYILHRALTTGGTPLSTVQLILEGGFSAESSARGVSINDLVLDQFTIHFMAICGYTDSVRLGVVGLAIARVRSVPLLRQIVGVLLQNGASLACEDQLNMGFSSLALLALRSFSDAAVAPLLLELFDGDFGIRLNYRMSDSRFRCADAVVAAAVAGNTSLLARLFAETAVSVNHLLWDLLYFAGRHRDLCRTTGPSAAAEAVTANTAAAVQLRRDIDAAVGRSTLFAIGCVRKCRQLQIGCTRINRALEAAASGHGRDAECERIWTRVTGAFDGPDRLQHLCRMEIRNRLIESNTDRTELRQKIDGLNVPNLIKSYLTFEGYVEVNCNS